MQGPAEVRPTDDPAEVAEESGAREHLSPTPEGKAAEEFAAIDRPADGECEWEVPTRLVRDHSDAVGVPEDALVEPGRAIHFRASEAMLAGAPRTCYAMTTDRLDALTG